MSDSDKYASRLRDRLAYMNTYYHQEPVLDIQDPPEKYFRRFRFVISSDVFEHVAPPIQKAFDNLHKIMAPGGTLVFTVPFSLDADTVEHFPSLHRYFLEDTASGYVLHNRTAAGEDQTFKDLVFHGGPGTTLEMRLFSESAIVRHLAAAGFKDIRVHREPAFEWGIYWSEPWSVPITATA